MLFNYNDDELTQMVTLLLEIFNRPYSLRGLLRLRNKKPDKPSLSIAPSKRGLSGFIGYVQYEALGYQKKIE